MPISSRTAQSIWKYLTTRKDALVNAPLFVAEDNTALDRHALRKALIRIGSRADVRNISVHRFRHTFAIQYLRNGGDVYTLQEMLGHTTMEMTRRYLAIANTDIESTHRRAAPVENWSL